MKSFVFLKRLAKECQDDDIFGLAAEMAYWVVFSIFPFFIFLAALTGIVGQLLGEDDLLTNIMTNLYSAVDYSTAETLRKPLNEVLSPNSGALSVSVAVSALIALNTASGAMGTAMKACNRAYGVRETRHFLAQKGMALAFTVLLTVSLIGGTILLSVGGHLVQLLSLGPFASTAFNVLRYGGTDRDRARLCAALLEESESAAAVPLGLSRRGGRDIGADRAQFPFWHLCAALRGGEF